MSLQEAFEIGQVGLEIREVNDTIKIIADTLQSSQDKIFLELPGLVAWWPGGPGDGLGAANDIVAARELTPVGTPTFGYDGHPYIETDRTGVDYFFGSPFPDCLGTEGWIDAGIRGLTIGCWIYLNSHATVTSGLVTRFGSAPQRGYSIQHNTATDAYRFTVSQTGSVAIFVDVDAPAVGEWVFVAGRFMPSTEIAVFVNGVKGVVTAGVYSSLFATSQSLNIGRIEADDSRILDGRLRDVFICQAALPDELIEEIRATSAP